MALISCPECNKEVSDKAHSCPSCGHPIATGQQTPVSAAKDTHKPGFSFLRIAGALFVVLLVLAGALVVAYMSSPTYQQRSLPPMPVQVDTRNALMGRGRVLEVRNISGRQLSILATLENPTTQQTKTFRLDVGPNQVSRVGHMEGWVVSSGDKITLKQADYQSWQGTAP